MERALIEQKGAAMKAIISGFVLLLAFAAMSHKGEDHSKAEIQNIPEDQIELAAKDYNEKIKPLFEKACSHCHGEAASMPWYYSLPILSSFMDSDMKEAKKHLDISKGFPFKGHGSPAEDLEAIANAIQEGEMPPLRYKIMHSSAWLTQKEKNEIIEWANKFLENQRESKK